MLACATTAPKKTGRVFAYQIHNDGKEIEPRHWVASWANTGVCLPD